MMPNTAMHQSRLRWVVSYSQATCGLVMANVTQTTCLPFTQLTPLLCSRINLDAAGSKGASPEDRCRSAGGGVEPASPAWPGVLLQDRYTVTAARPVAVAGVGGCNGRDGRPRNRG